MIYIYISICLAENIYDIYINMFWPRKFDKWKFSHRPHNIQRPCLDFEKMQQVLFHKKYHIVRHFFLLQNMNLILATKIKNKIKVSKFSD